MMPAVTPDELRARMRDTFGQIDDPVALARKCLRYHGLAGHRDEDDFLDVAIQAIVSAVLAWDPNGGRSVVSWVWLNMSGRVYEEVGRRRRYAGELGLQACQSEADWLHYDAGVAPYEQIEQRVDLQRWADLAQLTAYQRFVTEWFALHGGTRGRDDTDRSPLIGGGRSCLRLAFAHLRRAAATGERRNDKWTRLQARRSGESSRT